MAKKKAKKAAKTKAAPKKKAARKAPAKKKAAAKKPSKKVVKKAPAKAAGGLSKADQRDMLKRMMQIRAFEDKVFELLARDILKGASHVYAGQEAVAVGACAAIRDTDYITSTHRGHGHSVALGCDLKLMMAELCGKATGYCRGRGGSMHIADVQNRNLGATGIVGGNLPVATGAGLAARMKGEDSVVLCFFGDGAANEGTFHESLNMAGRWKLPVIYICENNLYGMSVAFEKACAVDDIAGRARGYSMPGKVVDGQRVLEVREAVLDAAAFARKGNGPTLIEAKTYRYRGHSRSDPRKYRTKEEEQSWWDRCPIKLFSEQLEAEGTLTRKEIDTLQAEVDGEIAAAEHFAVEESPYPDRSELYDDVFAGWKEGERRLERI